MYQDLKSKLSIYKASKQAEMAEKAGHSQYIENEKQADFTFSTNERFLPDSACEYDIQCLIDGKVVSNVHGSYFMIEKELPGSYLHGGFSLEDVAQINMLSLKRACRDLKDGINISDLLFLDTETTGLSGGAGTVAFLIGTGRFEDDRFVIRQFFMRDYDEEPAMLESFNRLLSGCKGLVTFNGKAFDWNLLLSRFAFNRFRPALNEPVNIDLLFPSRRIWKLKLDSCRLSSLEENILGEIRVNDIPGTMIPSIYFQYLDDRNAQSLKQVIKHNEADILSMTSLLAKIAAMLGDPVAESDGGLELLSLGRLFEASGDHGSVVECYEACMNSGNEFIRDAASRRLVGVYKRRREYGSAASHCERILGDSGGNDIFLLIELAKHYEHREKNIPKALSAVEKAIQRSSRVGFGNNIYHEELMRRMERLRRKALKEQQAFL